jgi:hypothetical protein
LVQYAFVQSFAGARWAVFSLLLLTLSPLFVHHTTVSYRDLTMLYFNCTTVLLSLWWFQTKRLRLLLLAAFFSGFTTFVKIEGMGFLPCYSAFVLVMLLASRELSWLEKVRAQLLFTGIGVAIWAIYASYKSSLGVVDGARYEITFGKEALMRVPAIIDAFTKNMFTSGNWSVVFGLFALSLLRFRRIWRDKLVLFSAMACLMFLAFYSLIAMLSPNFVYLAGADMSKGLARVFLHFWGLVPVAVVLINGREVCHDISDPRRCRAPEKAEKAL